MISAIENHRSVRRFLPDPIPVDVMERALAAAVRASNTGNMQVYSIIVTTDEKIRKELVPCHFNQPAAATAPVLVTFCADVNRFSLWCRQRGAEPRYGNFGWFVNGAIDAMLASENFCLQAEEEGLGICYLGTTTYTARDIIRVLDIPHGVVPVTTVAVGYPQQPEPPLTDRLPLEGVVHHDLYQDYSAEKIDRIWAEREASAETLRLIDENGLPNLACIFTERRYTGQDNVRFSQTYLEVLREQGFMDHEI